MKKTTNKTFRGNASQFFVAAELCRRGHSAVVTLGNTPNVDILCSNAEGTRFVHIQVKTFDPDGKRRTCSVGRKAEIDSGETFFWVLAGIPQPHSTTAFEFYIVPSKVMAEHVKASHRQWLNEPGMNGRAHADNSLRIVYLPPNTRNSGLNLAAYKDHWEQIDQALA